MNIIKQLEEKTMAFQVSTGVLVQEKDLTESFAYQLLSALTDEFSQGHFR